MSAILPKGLGVITTLMQNDREILSRRYPMRTLEIILAQACRE